jgi:hypothetical protein
LNEPSAPLNCTNFCLLPSAAYKLIRLACLEIETQARPARRFGLIWAVVPNRAESRRNTGICPLIKNWRSAVHSRDAVGDSYRNNGFMNVMKRRFFGLQCWLAHGDAWCRGAKR